MSEWLPEVVRIGEVFPHPNRDHADPKLKCDTLSLTMVHGGYPVLFRTGEFKEGDLAAYVPIDSVVPENHPLFSFLGDSRRIKAKRMRGVFSMGMLVRAPDGLAEGSSVVEALNLTKYEPKEETLKMSRGVSIPGPSGWEFPKYTDIEGIRRYKHVLLEGEEVVITEKIHGQNARFCWDPDDKKLWVGSRTTIKKRDATVNWWHIANKLDLEEKLAKFPLTIFFGEVYGKSIQDLAYGLEHKDLLIFDTFDVKTGTYNDWDATVALVKEAGLNLVPTLYRGPWLGFEAHKPLSEGKSTICDHIREGYVVKPVHERREHMGRVILKCVGEDYMTR
jgi:RNA ligase (TIGR02306 family)